MKKCWSIVTTVILIVAVILCIAFAGVRVAGLTPYVVSSGSMEPMYPVGSLIYVKETDPADVQEGDSITFYMDNGTTVATHQVYKIDREEELFYTQGINNRDSEGNILHDASPVAYQSLIGSPRFVIPYLGYINRICTTKPGIYVLVGGAAAVLLISILIESKGEKKIKKRNKKRKRKKRGTQV